MTESCDTRTRTYRNGKTFDQCRQEARKNSLNLASEISTLGQITWNRVLEAAGHDEVVYKLTLKFLRESGHNIGNSSNPQVALK